MWSIERRVVEVGVLLVGCGAVTCIEPEEPTISSFGSELIAWVDPPDSTGVPSQLERGARWQFWNRSVAPGVTWATPAYDTTAWSSGVGPLGVGEDVVTALTRGPITSYFRTQFTSDGSATALVAEVMCDGGFIAYLNGHEIARRSMPTGAIGADTAALDHETDGRYQVLSWNDALPYLVQGENTLAVETHQVSASSSHLVFDLALHVEGSWYPQPSGTIAALRDVTFLDRQRGWVVGDGGALLRTTDGGLLWQSVETHTAANLSAIQIVDDRHGWIVGEAGALLASSDGGVTWSARAPVTTDDIVSLFFADATTGWFVTGAAAYQTTDGGLNWVAQQIGTTDVEQPSNREQAPLAIAMVDDEQGWAVGAGGLILHTENGGR